MSYAGMRWFKCDFQMQTPADSANWKGQKGADSEAASAYIKRCHEVGLQCIAITDHNLAGTAFVELLNDANRRLAAELGVPAIHILHGFELEANVGKGIHVLAIFDGSTPLQHVDHILTECGVPFPRFEKGQPLPSRSDLRSIISKVQVRGEDNRLRGIVICPHVSGENGLFDNDSISDWLQREEWTNPDLLAVEVSRPVGEMNKAWQRLFGNGEECFPEWRRIRPIGRFMSSDCKALTAKECPENYIGKRYCWVKMSVPSVESLRQAALDHESRISLAEVAPEVAHRYIESVSISGVRFLADQTIHFSPNLNCLIGGRGSGKSTILEYLRMALRAFPAGYKEDGTSAAEEQIRRIRGTLTSETRIEVRVKSGELTEEIELLGTKGQGEIVGRQVSTPDVVFQQIGVLAFSQEEVTQLASGSTFIDLIDGMSSQTEIVGILSRAQKSTDDLRVLFAQRTKARTLRSELETLNQSMREVVRQFSAVASLQNELNEVKLAGAAFSTLASLSSSVVDTSKALANWIGEIARQKGMIPGISDMVSGHATLLSIDSRVRRGYDDLIDDLHAARKRFLGTAEIPIESNEVQEIGRAEKAKRDALRSACEANGISEAVVSQLDSLSRRQVELADSIDKLNRELAALDADVERIPAAMDELSAAWLARTECRRRTLQAILESSTMPRTDQNDPILRASIRRGGSWKDFKDLWEKLNPDRRTRLGRAWFQQGDDPGIGEVLFSSYLTGRRQGNPIWWLDEGLDGDTVVLPPPIEQLKGDLREFRENNRDSWEMAMLTWLGDDGDITLLRSDGSVAGNLAKMDLSDGQKNTAILSLLLARGDGPILIDQPENELDTAFLYTELVPMLRRAKLSRQIIVCTHNANIPVNADAEMIYALEAKGGRGISASQGALDRATVCQAVIDIMEGSSEAFRRRFEKYHF